MPNRVAVQNIVTSYINKEKVSFSGVKMTYFRSRHFFLQILQEILHKQK